MIAVLGMLIPILALSIPIVAILARTYEKTRRDNNSSLSTKVQELEEMIHNLRQNNERLEKTVLQLEEKQDFLTRLLEEKS